MRKQVAFVANSLDNAFKFRQVFSELDVDVSASSTAQVRSLLKPGALLDLVIFEAVGQSSVSLDEIQLLAENQGIPLLVIVDEEGLSNLTFSGQTPSDFIVSDAGVSECMARVKHLIGGRILASADDIIVVEDVVDDMIVNLNTYQVSIAGTPVDLTYLEYALLAFFVRHPCHTFSRNMLLQNVWGFDYGGGSRTVDVHVRRIRSKLGPGLAQHLETIRGVGYLWNPN